VITHPEKVMFPDDGITKGELAGYYEMVAAVMLPHIRNRPLTMERFHRGIGEKGFFQKNVAKPPQWLKTVAVPKKDGVVNYPLVSSEQGIEWLANQNCITPHVWTSRAPDLEHPDIAIFDLDPLEDHPKVLRDVCVRLRDLLGEEGHRSWVKTSGSKGFHIAVPISGKKHWTEVSKWAHGVARELVKRDPKHLTLEFYKADRGGRIFVDPGRNEIGATYAAPYAVRARACAPVSAPCTWDEVEKLQVLPTSIRLRDMQARLREVGDLWSFLDLRDSA
jgi:bifunctional non-homologous end joining protein LigD